MGREAGPMLVRKIGDHSVVQTPTCGEIREILRNGDFEGFDLAVAVDIRPTKAHFHKSFDEIYFILDGSIELKLLDPERGRISEHRLDANEVCVIPRGVHHKIVAASPANRLCVISVPRWSGGDEHLSEAI